MARTAAATQRIGSTSHSQHAAQNASWFAYKAAKATTEKGSAIIARKRAVEIALRPALGPDTIIGLNNYRRDPTAINAREKAVCKSTDEIRPLHSS
jgi:hypothetical protein